MPPTEWAASSRVSGADPVRDRLQRVVVGRVAGVVDGRDDPGAVGDRRVDGRGVEQRGVLLDVGEDDLGAEDRRRTEAVATNVIGVVTTWSPGPSRSAEYAMCRAAVPDVQLTAR